MRDDVNVIFIMVVIAILLILVVGILLTSHSRGLEDSDDNFTTLHVNLSVTFPENETIVEDDPVPTLKDKILEVASEVANNHEYIEDVYDCTQFTEELRVRLLNDLNVESSRQIRVVNCSAMLNGKYYWDKDNCNYYGGMHMFLKVQTDDPFCIEATSGHEILEEHYEFYSINYPVDCD